MKMKNLLFVTMFLTVIGCFKNKIPEYCVIKIKTPVIIDGEIDESWNMVKEEQINNKLSGSQYTKDSNDFSAYYKAIWDIDNIYFLFVIFDDIKFDHKFLKYEEDAPARSCENDCIELFIDSKNRRKNNFDVNDNNYRYEFVFSKNTITGVYSSKNDIEFAQTDTTNGYIFEIKIPFKTLNVGQPENGYIIGCEICVNDNDNDVNSGSYKIERAIISWSEKGYESTAWKNTYVYGKLKLIE